jgi:hypothetical protein
MTYVGGAQLKIIRAFEHLQLITDKAAEFVEENLRFNIQPSPTGLDDEWEVLAWTASKPLYEEFGVWLGDLVHNIRSALDYCVYATATEGGQGSGEHAQFPIYDNRKEWVKDIDERDPKRLPSPLSGVSPASAQYAIIEKAQPYHMPTANQRLRHPLFQLLRISNIDKHRTLHAARALSTRPTVSYEPRGFVAIGKLKWGENWAAVKEGVEICRVRRRLLSFPPPGTTVNVRLRGNIFLAFREPGKLDDISTSPELVDICETASSIVDAFAQTEQIATQPGVIVPDTAHEQSE